VLDHSRRAIFPGTNVAYIGVMMMKREMLIRNISYMKRELSEMEKELAMMDAKAELLEPMRQWVLDSKSKDNYR